MQDHRGPPGLEFVPPPDTGHEGIDKRRDLGVA